MAGTRPIEVIKKVGSQSYNLKLPQQWKSVQAVFHVSLLEPVKQSAILNQHQFLPPPVLVEEQEEWEVAQVLESKLKRVVRRVGVEVKPNTNKEKKTRYLYLKHQRFSKSHLATHLHTRQPLQPSLLKQYPE
ncbi:hypothetical protein O181_077246 [Austropuccinia psidii MF-1]|uniref:Tf2-1-like SH3-like domain-containing protein n=1 Tax=Austropuccinia psidii MF-1 TaxID=1389203 RepID=A0A9Q3FHQ2_9BASI|nr:hypothetical protein [Austropuccinia psidii MF-1]